MFRNKVIHRIANEFGHPSRDIEKVIAWNITKDFSIVVQKDQPNAHDYAYVWLPYPPERESFPEYAIEYPAESGRHSNTYPAPGLERGKPA